ncbi:unnamed protein product, partial [Ilex paraguariensis]
PNKYRSVGQQNSPLNQVLFHQEPQESHISHMQQHGLYKRFCQQLNIHVHLFLPHHSNPHRPRFQFFVIFEILKGLKLFKLFIGEKTPWKKGFWRNDGEVEDEEEEWDVENEEMRL